MGIKTTIGNKGVVSQWVDGEGTIVFEKTVKALYAFDIDNVVSYDRNKITTVTKSSNFIFGDYGVVLVDCSAGAVTGTLEIADQDSVYRAKKIDSSGYPFVLSGSSIDGQTKQIITDQYTSITVIGSGSSWYII